MQTVGPNSESWKKATAALPEGWRVSQVHWSDTGCYAEAVGPLVRSDGMDWQPVRTGEGPTQDAALEALAAEKFPA